MFFHLHRDSVVEDVSRRHLETLKGWDAQLGRAEKGRRLSYMRINSCYGWEEHLERVCTCLLGCLVLLSARPGTAQEPHNPSDWTIFITNFTCPDYTWGFTAEQTRQSFADLVRAHLDEMNRTDNEPPENQDHYNLAVTQEALCFVERYPDRKDEFIRRIKEGRICVSPFLDNSLWGFQSVEGGIRTLYPARRLEREWGIPIDIANHIELPSLPWGATSILAGSGVRWLLVPFLDYDSTFAGLTNPPLFVLEGPDGERLRVHMDSWAAHEANYAQAAALLRDPKLILNDWLPHYEGSGNGYPVRVILASGTHGDYSPTNWSQARGFADAIIKYNRQPGAHPRLVNAALPQFFQAIDAAERKTPFLPTVRGSFGNSWELWPVSLAKYVSDMREGERKVLAAETLLALAARQSPELLRTTRGEREQAEWSWAMLADHAWNGTDETNRKVNAELRRNWSAELLRLSADLMQKGWAALGLQRSDRYVAIFNSLGSPRSDLASLEAPQGIAGIAAGSSILASQVVEEDGRQMLYFLSPRVEGFSLQALKFKADISGNSKGGRLQAGRTELESPYYRLKVDERTGGVCSLIHKATGTELVSGNGGHTLGQTIYFDGEEHALSDARSEVVAAGPLLARLRITGTVAGIKVVTLVTVYSALDRVDLETRIHKPVTTQEQRLTQVFPVMRPGARMQIETAGAVIRPELRPEGDLLPGADTRRFAIQGFVDVSFPDGAGVTIAPLDSYALRQDLGPVTFENLGNDQNYKEVIRDQDGIVDFRFRYSLRAYSGGFDSAKAFEWSRSVATPLLAVLGRLPEQWAVSPPLELDSRRVIATALKPADDPSAGGTILRIWEVAGLPGPVNVRVGGFKRAIRTDLLERNLEELPVVNGRVSLGLRAHGFSAVRLLP